jgi:hypothetical protein
MLIAGSIRDRRPRILACCHRRKEVEMMDPAKHDEGQTDSEREPRLAPETVKDLAPTDDMAEDVAGGGTRDSRGTVCMGQSYMCE